MKLLGEHVWMGSHLVDIFHIGFHSDKQAQFFEKCQCRSHLLYNVCFPIVKYKDLVKVYPQPRITYSFEPLVAHCSLIIRSEPWMSHNWMCTTSPSLMILFAVYSPDMPSRLPLRIVLSGLASTVATAVRFWIHYTLVALAWLGESIDCYYK